jgi:hypothetical protein
VTLQVQIQILRAHHVVGSAGTTRGKLKYQQISGGYRRKRLAFSEIIQYADKDG